MFWQSCDQLRSGWIRKATWTMTRLKRIPLRGCHIVGLFSFQKSLTNVQTLRKWSIFNYSQISLSQPRYVLIGPNWIIQKVSDRKCVSRSTPKMNWNTNQLRLISLTKPNKRMQTEWKWGLRNMDDPDRSSEDLRIWMILSSRITSQHWAPMQNYQGMMAHIHEYN